MILFIGKKKGSDNSASFGMNEDEDSGIQMIFSDIDHSEFDYDVLSCSHNGLNEDCGIRTKSSSQTEPICLLQSSGKIVLNNLRAEDNIDEFLIEASFFLPVIGIGIYPDFVLSLSVDKVEAILSNFFYR